MAEATRETLEYYNKRFGEKTSSILPSNDHDQVRWGVIESYVKTVVPGFKGQIAILDFGCGTGWLSALLSPYGKITGVDVADKAVASASERFPDLEFVCLNAEMNEKDPFFERRFDLIISSEVIEHIQEQKQYISNMMTLLKPGGRFIITTPNGKWISEWFTGERNSYRQPVENWVTSENLISLLGHYATIDYKSTFYSQWIYYYPNKVAFSHLFLRIKMKLIKIFGTFHVNLEKMNKEGFGLYLIFSGVKN